MLNRLTRRRQAILIGGGCIFAAALLLFAPGAQAAAIQYDLFASGDVIAVSGSMTWMAGTHDLNSVPPLDCAGEVLMGGHDTRVLGTGSYQASATLDATDLMLYQYQTDADLGKGIYQEGLYVDGCGSPWVESTCGPMPEQGETVAAATAYCSGASFSTQAMGRQLTINSAGATVQAGEFPDSLAATTRISGDGMASINIRSWNLAGIGNTTGLGYQNGMSQRIFAEGHTMQTGADFAWSSFAGLWAEPPAEPDEPAEGETGYIPPDRPTDTIPEETG